MPWQKPTQPSKLTGKTRAKVTNWKEVSSKFGQPQIQFTFTTEKGNQFSLWCSVTSERAVNTFLDAGILRETGPDEFDVVSLQLQPTLIVQLKDGKLEKFETIQK